MPGTIAFLKRNSEWNGLSKQPSQIEEKKYDLFKTYISTDKITSTSYADSKKPSKLIWFCMLIWKQIVFLPVSTTASQSPLSCVICIPFPGLFFCLLLPYCLILLYYPWRLNIFPLLFPFLLPLWSFLPILFFFPTSILHIPFSLTLPSYQTV